jgi:hypothetical protein
MAINLESSINNVGYEITNIIDKNNIEKLLGVLSNDGVYAMWVYAKSKKDINEIKLMRKIKPIIYFVKGLRDDNYEQYFQELSQDLNNLLFFRELLEKVLIYARYHAKAMEE